MGAIAVQSDALCSLDDKKQDIMFMDVDWKSGLEEKVLYLMHLRTHVADYRFVRS